MMQTDENTPHTSSSPHSVVISALKKSDNFKDAVRSGCAEIDQIDDWVDFWHLPDSPVGEKSLREFIGLSTDEYIKWMKDASILSDIFTK